MVFRMILQVACYVQLNFPGMTTNVLLINNAQLPWHILFDSVCCKIRTAELDISEDYFLACLYPKGLGNPNNVESGFLYSGLLVKVHNFFINYLPTNQNQTFCILFTSPLSSDAFEEEESEEGPSWKKQKSASQRKATKTNVATLLHMEGRVTSRAIVYAATLVSWHSFLLFISLNGCLACLQSACGITVGWTL